MGKDHGKINAYFDGTKSTESWKLLKSFCQNNKDITSPIITKWDEYFGKILKETRGKFMENKESNRVYTRFCVANQGQCERNKGYLLRS